MPVLSETKPTGYSLVYALSLIVSISVTILYVIGQSDLEFMRIFSNIVFAPVAFAPVIVALETSRRYGWEFESKLGFIWLTFLTGLFLWFLGEFVWANYVLGLKIDVPYPSLADVFYQFGYPCIHLRVDHVLHAVQASVEHEDCKVRIVHSSGCDSVGDRLSLRTDNHFIRRPGDNLSRPNLHHARFGYLDLLG